MIAGCIILARGPRVWDPCSRASNITIINVSGGHMSCQDFFGEQLELAVRLIGLGALLNLNKIFQLNSQSVVSLCFRSCKRIATTLPIKFDRIEREHKGINSLLLPSISFFQNLIKAEMCSSILQELSLCVCNFFLLPLIRNQSRWMSVWWALWCYFLLTLFEWCLLGNWKMAFWKKNVFIFDSWTSTMRRCTRGSIDDQVWNRFNKMERLVIHWWK